MNAVLDLLECISILNELLINSFVLHLGLYKNISLTLYCPPCLICLLVSKFQFLDKKQAVYCIPGRANPISCAVGLR